MNHSVEEGWFGLWAMVWMVWSMSYGLDGWGISNGLDGLGYELWVRWFGVELWSECCGIWAMVWMVWDMSHGVDGLDYELWFGWFGIWAMIWIFWVWAMARMVWGLSYGLSSSVYELFWVVVGMTCGLDGLSWTLYPAEKMYEDLRSGWSLGFLLDKNCVWRHEVMNLVKNLQQQPDDM